MSEPLLNEDTISDQRNTEKKGVGPVVSIVVVVILIVLGGVYFFITQAAKLHNVPAGQEPANS